MLSGKTTNPPTRVGGLVVLPLNKTNSALGSNPRNRASVRIPDETKLRSAPADSSAPPIFLNGSSPCGKGALETVHKKKGVPTRPYALGLSSSLKETELVLLW